MVLFSAKTGLVEALLLDNGYLTDVRTAAAGAVAAKHLAPAHVETAGVLGTGVQAHLQMRALHLVRPFEKLLVWGRDAEKAAACAEGLADALGVEARACAGAEEVVAESQAVVTTTPSREPILKAEWLHPGLHVTAMGSDASEKNEIEPAALAKADVFVCDRKAQAELLGELHHALEQGVVGEDFPVVELGDIIAGETGWKPSAEAVSICDLTGTGVQDTAIATHAFALARAAEAGTVIKA
jgi:ornithine cyclodeaminase